MGNDIFKDGGVTHNKGKQVCKCTYPSANYDCINKVNHMSVIAADI